MSDKITVPIEGKPLIQKASKIPWRNTTLTFQKEGYIEVYGYGRRIIHCDTSCRRNSGLHRLHPGGNRGSLLGTSRFPFDKRVTPYPEYIREMVNNVSVILGSSGSQTFEPEPFEPDDDYLSIVSPFSFEDFDYTKQDKLIDILESQERWDQILDLLLTRWKSKRSRVY